MKKKEPVKQKNKKSSAWLIAAAIVVFAGVVWFSMRSTETPSSQSSAQNTAIPGASAPSADSGPSSQYATLSPSMFTGKAREAYQAAKDVPEVLRQVKCYCGCQRTAGHRNNLDCFTDEHGFG